MLVWCAALLAGVALAQDSDDDADPGEPIELEQSVRPQDVPAGLKLPRRGDLLQDSDLRLVWDQGAPVDGQLVMETLSFKQKIYNGYGVVVDTRDIPVARVEVSELGARLYLPLGKAPNFLREWPDVGELDQVFLDRRNEGEGTIVAVSGTEVFIIHQTQDDLAGRWWDLGQLYRGDLTGYETLVTLSGQSDPHVQVWHLPPPKDEERPAFRVRLAPEKIDGEDTWTPRVSATVAYKATDEVEPAAQSAEAQALLVPPKVRGSSGVRVELSGGLANLYDRFDAGATVMAWKNILGVEAGVDPDSVVGSGYFGKRTPTGLFFVGPGLRCPLTAPEDWATTCKLENTVRIEGQSWRGWFLAGNTRFSVAQGYFSADAGLGKVWKLPKRRYGGVEGWGGFWAGSSDDPDVADPLRLIVGVRLRFEQQAWTARGPLYPDR